MNELKITKPPNIEGFILWEHTGSNRGFPGYNLPLMIKPFDFGLLFYDPMSLQPMFSY